MTETIKRLFQGLGYIGSATASRYQPLSSTPFLDSRQRLAQTTKKIVAPLNSKIRSTINGSNPSRAAR